MHVIDCGGFGIYSANLRQSSSGDVVCCPITSASKGRLARSPHCRRKLSPDLNAVVAGAMGQLQAWSLGNANDLKQTGGKYAAAADYRARQCTELDRGDPRLCYRRLGVFIGIQVSNWNDARAVKQLERDLLVELRTEIEKSIRVTSGRKNYFEGIAAAGDSSLAFIAADNSCVDDCWRRLVDLFHASQWSDVRIKRAAYGELRRLGLPRSRLVSDAVEAYYGHNDSLVRVLDERPAYRNLVRGLIPVAAQTALWLKCHASENGVERLVPDCEPGVPSELSNATVEAIRSHTDISTTLTHWAGTLVLAPPYLVEQNAIGGRAISTIDEELGLNR